MLDGCTHISHIEGTDLLHLFLRQREIPNIEVFFYPYLMSGFRDNDDASLYIPAQDNL